MESVQITKCLGTFINKKILDYALSPLPDSIVTLKSRLAIDDVRKTIEEMVSKIANITNN